MYDVIHKLPHFSAVKKANANDCLCLTSYTITLRKYMDDVSMVAELIRASRNSNVTTLTLKVELQGRQGELEEWSTKEEGDVMYNPGEVSVIYTLCYIYASNGSASIVRGILVIVKTIGFRFR